MSDEKESPPPQWAVEMLEQQERQEAHLRAISDRQRRTAKAVADLALGMQAETHQSRARHSELLGVALAQRAQRTLAAGGAREREDDTDRVEIAKGVDVELSRARQRQLVQLFLTVLKAALLLAAGSIATLVHQLITASPTK